MSKSTKTASREPRPLVTKSSSIRSLALLAVGVAVIGGVAGYFWSPPSEGEQGSHPGIDEFEGSTTQYIRSRFRWLKRNNQAKNAQPGDLLVEEPYPFDQAEEEAQDEFFPRDPLEWQGLLVQTTTRLNCESSAQCPNGLACVAEFCSACTDDTDCGTAEVCSMDHCLPEGNVSCRSRLECDTTAGELCALSGYTSSVRGNEETLAYCAAVEGSALFPRGVDEEEVAAMNAEGSSVAVPSPRDQLVIAVRASAP